MEGAENPEGKVVQTECCPLISANVRRVVTLTCCFLMSCTLGTIYTFGNINPYLTSYLRNHTSDHELDFTDTLWIYQSYGLVSCTLMPVVGLMANRVHTKVFMTVGLVFQVSCFVGTYWTVQQSFPLVVVTYGVLSGVPCAFIDPTSIRICVGWMPQRKGVVCAVVLMGYGVGAMVWNELTTWFINPNNLQPDLRVNQDMYYSQAAVLENVPGCFLMVGVACGCVQVLCILLLCLPPPPSPPQTMYTDASQDERRKLLDGDTPAINSDGQDSTGAAASVCGAVNCRQSVSGSDVRAACCRQTVGGESAHRVEITEVEEVQYTPGQMLKSRVFWTLWLMLVSSALGFNYVITLFKAYGQTFIDDDHFLTLVATLSSVCNAVGRPFWGMLSDRIGHRIVALLAQALFAALVGSFATCEVTGKAGFMLWVCGMFLSMCGVFTMVYALVIALFGAKHFNVNMGLLMTFGVIGLLLSGLLAPILKDALGWHGLFYVSFGGLFVGMLLTMSLSIPWGDSIPRHMWPVLSLHS